MSANDYIRQEVALMKKECRRLGIHPEEWIKRFAIKYHNQFSEMVMLTHHLKTNQNQ
ncbi:MAG: hypothetical protein HYS07_10395 [Chlamydiae bacterium]|nr:hypothetical protein [Chlamydiota bacterium]